MIFYTYLWLREDGTPYYAGKGTGKRGRYSCGHRVPCPKDVSRILIQEFPSEADAFEAEKFLIRLYGRKDLGTGCLRNLSDGGDGPSGAKRKPISEQTRQRMRLAKVDKPSGRKGYKASEETKQKQRLAKLGKSLPENHKANISRSLVGNTNSCFVIRSRDDFGRFS